MFDILQLHPEARAQIGEITPTTAISCFNNGLYGQVAYIDVVDPAEAVRIGSTDDKWVNSPGVITQVGRKSYNPIEAGDILHKDGIFHMVAKDGFCQLN